jgi:hypothetical protein
VSPEMAYPAISSKMASDEGAILSWSRSATA